MNSIFKARHALIAVLLGTLLSACASAPRKTASILGENQIVDLGSDKSCRVVKSGAQNFRCVPLVNVASRARAK